jgi:hypothetical protein
MLKLVVVIVLGAHGLGHTMALSSAFRPAGGFSRRHWTLSDGVAIYTPAGKALALVWLVPLAGFLAGAYGLWTGQEWWRPVLTISSGSRSWPFCPGGASCRSPPIWARCWLTCSSWPRC